ncbi:MAG: site-2 protease family protein [Opitutales bacterium]
MFRVFGIQLAIHASFLLLLAYEGWVGWREGGWEGMVVNLVLIVLFFTCVVMHELGHSLTARRFGVRVPRILLMPIGGMAEFDHIPRQPRAELLITAAGPVVNFVIAALLYAIFGVPKGWPSWNAEYADTWTGLAQVLLTWNFIMGCFNLLPVFPMDGGRIFRAILASRMPYLRATYWAAMIGKGLALAGAALAAFYFNNFLTTGLFLFIFLAADAEYRAVLRREQEAAYWAEMSRRMAAAPPAGGESPPPLLYHGPN